MTLRDNDEDFNRVMLRERITGYTQDEEAKVIDVDALVEILISLGVNWSDGE